MGTLEAAQTKLSGAGVSGSTWPCYIGYVPDSPDQVIGLQWTGGFAQDTHSGENMLQTLQVQIRAGALEHAACEAKWLAMFAALNDANLTSDGIQMIQAMASGPMYFLDDKNRPVMTANFKAVRAA